MRSPIERIRWGLQYIRTRYGSQTGTDHRPRLFPDDDVLRRIIREEVAAAIEENTRRQARTMRKGR